MPPKVKFTKEELVETALEIVREKGIDGVTAREIAARKGASTQPVFSCFSSMDEVKREVRTRSEMIYENYVLGGLREKVPFFGFGMAYIRFAKEEPELYRLLFFGNSERGDVGATETMRRASATLVPMLEKIYNIMERQAERLYRDMWLVVHGLASLIVAGCCPYSDAEIGKILTGFSISVCKAIKEIPGFTDGTFDRDEVFKKLVKE